MDRRIFLKASARAAELCVLITAGLLTPLRVLAIWPAEAFHGDTLDIAMQGLLGSAKPISSDLIDISTPELAENGANVPVEIKTAIPNSEVIYLFAEKNPFPAVAEFMLSPEVESFVSCRVKLAETGYLVVVVRADGRLFSARKPVTVVTGGCAT